MWTYIAIGLAYSFTHAITRRVHDWDEIKDGVVLRQFRAVLQAEA